MILKTPNEMAVSAAERFREIRRQKKITIKELCERSGVPNSTIRRFEHTGEISFMAFVKLSSAIGADRDIENLFARPVPSTIEEVLYENRRKTNRIS